MRSSVTGQGLVLLLHGASSVGKKSTAGKPRDQFSFPILCQYTELFVITASIARMAGVPLLHISTGKRNQVELAVHVE